MTLGAGLSGNDFAVAAATAVAVIVALLLVRAVTVRLSTRGQEPTR